MKVYVGGKARDNARYTLHICPAADKETGSEVPSEWVNDHNEPLTFNIDFFRGCADVPEHLGAYLIKRGLAKKTPFFHPDEIRFLKTIDPRDFNQNLLKGEAV